MNADKNALRRRMLAEQKALPDDYVLKAGEAMEQAVLSLAQYRLARAVFLYLSMPKEPATSRILRHALESGREVYVPKCVNSREMLAVRLRSLAGLAPGRYGIPEPQSVEESRTADSLDLILVPCVCASQDGRRLGHGAGYYDRFLAGKAENAVCLCFHRMLRDDIPVLGNDVRMPAVLTERGMFVNQPPR
ncbi:MAG: 5-formyltetrahydrofolate cyclo-ligase [Clostridia bacterium]|nr:5-formyltetrahydrofolate cyclo-ligase [Clostridia bacterium]